MTSIPSLFSDAMAIIDRDSTPEVLAIANVLRSTPIQYEDMGRSPYAQYKPDSNLIVVNTNAQAMRGIDAIDLSATLLHEGKHALDHATGVLSMSMNPIAPERLHDEETATMAEARFWHRLFPLNNHPAVNELELMEADKQKHLAAGDLPQAVDAVYTQRYFEQFLGGLFG